MSVTLSSLRARVMSRLKEMDSRKPIGRVYVDQMLRDEYLMLQARLPAAYAYTASAGTITAGAVSFTLPAAEYASDLRVQLQSDNQFLVRLHQDEMQAWRNGSGTSSTGRPRYFAPYEEDDQQVVSWVWPIAAATETYNLFRSIVAADFSATDVAGTTLYLGRYGAQALIMKAAASILAAMDDDGVKQRRLNQSVAQKWDQEGERMLYLEGSRRSDVESVGRVMRFVS